MSHVTRILSAIEQGDGQAAEQLLPLVYDELRKLAAAKLANEKPGQTLQATALVHEAYIRLVDPKHAGQRSVGDRDLAANRPVRRRGRCDEKGSPTLDLHDQSLAVGSRCQPPMKLKTMAWACRAAARLTGVSSQ